MIYEHDERLHTKIQQFGCYYNPRTEYTHFVVLNNDKKIEYDPLNGESVTIKEGYLHSLRVIHKD